MRDPPFERSRSGSTVLRCTNARPSSFSMLALHKRQRDASLAVLNLGTLP